MHNILGQDIRAGQVLRWLRVVLLVLAGVSVLLALLLWRVWQIRGSIEDIGWQTSPELTRPMESVTVTWLGITTLLFDDGETQILIDGAFTRVGALKALLLRPVTSDVATINYALAHYGMDRLAAIIPVDSHFDHAIDIGQIANRTTAVVLGSESTANIVRGADVPVDQYQILADGETRQFGKFTITLIASRHAPIGLDDEEIFPGIIEIPLRQPARISDYRTGITWSVVIGHPRGTTLVQGSAGFIPGKLDAVSADVAMLGLAGLSRLGRDYTRDFWKDSVVASGASRVIAIHHDDFMAPFGEIRLLPEFLDNVLVTRDWIDELVADGDGDISVELPPFGVPVVLY